VNKQQYFDMYKYENSHWWFLGKHLFIGSVLSGLKNEPRNILDIGSGTGGTTKFLEQWGNITGIEKNKIAYELAKKRHLNIIKADANKLPFPDKSFDLITIIDVLYHKEINENKIIRETSRVLKKGGKLLIMDCALPFLWSEHDIVMQARKRFWANEVDLLLEKGGFKLIKLSYIFILTLPFLTIHRYCIKLKIIKEKKFVKKMPRLLNIILLGLIFIESKLFKFINLPLGSSILAYGEKR
jgi:SAM-dependent methyltransferase